MHRDQEDAARAKVDATRAKVDATRAKEDGVVGAPLLPAGLRVWRLRVRAPWEEPLGGIVLRFGLIAGASCGLILT